MLLMDRSKEILTEIQEIAPILADSGLPRIPYSLPIGYFERFPDILMERILLEGSMDTDFAKGIPEISSRQEIAEISGLLAGLQHKNPYQVPEGYFESLNKKMPVTEVVAKESMRVIPIESRKEKEKHTAFQSRQKTPVFHFSRVLKYSVAACIVALIGLNLYNLTSQNDKFTDPISGLTKVSDQEMANYLDAADIHWTPGLGASSGTASVDFSDNDMHELFSNVGDDELEQYLPTLSTEKGNVN
jgi:hypothetical protein